MQQDQRVGRAVRVADDAGHGPAGRQVGEADETDAVVLLDALVVVGVLERERQQSLFLQIGLVDARKAAGDHRGAAEKPRRQCGMLAAAAFAIVEIADCDPADAARLIVTGDPRKRLVALARQHVLALAGLAGEGVGRAHEHVVAELVEVAAIAQPRAGRRDVVGRGLALGLEQHGHVEKVVSVPRGPWLQALQPLALGIDLERDVADIVGRSDVSGLSAREVLRRHLRRRLGRIELERLAVAVGEGVAHRIERQASRKRECCHQLRAGDEIHRRRLPVIAPREVAIVGRDDRVGRDGCFVRPAPLSDAGAAGIGQHGPVDRFE